MKKILGTLKNLLIMPLLYKSKTCIEERLKKVELILKSPLDFTLLVTVFILLGLGIITVLSASSPTALAETGDSYRYVERQIISAAIGIGCMFVLSKLDYKLFQKYYKIIFMASIILLLAVPIIGVSSGGAKRWIALGSISFQPSEIAKVGVIIFYATWLTKNKDKLKSFKNGFFIPLAMMLPIIVIVLVLVQVGNHILVLVIVLVIVIVIVIVIVLVLVQV